MADKPFDPNGWYIANWSSETITGPFRTRRAALDHHHVRDMPCIERHSYGPGSYEYVVSYPGEESSWTYDVLTGDRVTATGYGDPDNWERQTTGESGRLT